jgi:hypothetical protein
MMNQIGLFLPVQSQQTKNRLDPSQRIQAAPGEWKWQPTETQRAHTRAIRTIRGKQDEFIAAFTQCPGLCQSKIIEVPIGIGKHQNFHINSLIDL